MLLSLCVSQADATNISTMVDTTISYFYWRGVLLYYKGLINIEEADTVKKKKKNTYFTPLFLD